ncbi:MAG: tetratricopeptide repeat protein [Akkermansia sp.]
MVQKAAEQGHAVAQLNLGWIYANSPSRKTGNRPYTGTSRPRNRETPAPSITWPVLWQRKRDLNPRKAAYWYEEAAMQNHARPNTIWAGAMKRFRRGAGPDKALVWYHKSALQGQITAQYTLGWCYGNGHGVEMNMSKAVYWYTKAAEQGHNTAQLNLGWCHLNGKGTPVNHAEALKWYLKAADQGNATAMFNVGNCYAHGYGIEENDEEAEAWYQKAIAHGNKKAASALRHLHSKQEKRENGSED